MPGKKFTSINNYHSSFPKDVREKLETMRSAISNAAPNAVETISYNIPTFKQNYWLVSYGGFKNHIGFFPGAGAIVDFKKELTKFKTSKGTIQFPFEKPLPISLIKKIVKYRLAQEREKIKNKIKLK